MDLDSSSTLGKDYSGQCLQSKTHYSGPESRVCLSCSYDGILEEDVEKDSGFDVHPQSRNLYLKFVDP